MATAYLTEISNTVKDVYKGVNSAPVAMFPAVANQTITFTTSTQSAAFNANTNLLHIETVEECFYAVGENPTATSASTHLAAGADIWIGVNPGHKVAFIAAS